MPDLADLFPGFASEWISTRNGRIFARVGGKGPPLLLLHGFSETHVMWHRVAPLLAEKFTLVIADLPGYGWSDVPRSDADHTPFTKRAMAQVMIEAMEKLGYVHFGLAGHDRGGRVSYRLALDHPGRLSRLATLDILPTYDYWAKMDRGFALKVYHWSLLAQPSPLPETLIGGNADFYLKNKLASWSKTKDLSIFDPRALEHYLVAFRDPLRFTQCARTTAPALMPISSTTRPISKPAGKSPCRCSSFGATEELPRPPQRRSTRGRRGPPTSAASRLIPVISSLKKTPRRPQQHY